MNIKRLFIVVFYKILCCFNMYIIRDLLVAGAPRFISNGLMTQTEVGWEAAIKLE